MFPSGIGSKLGGFGRGGGAIDNGCRACGQQGHFARECPVVRSESTGRNDSTPVRPSRIGNVQPEHGSALAGETRERQPVKYVPVETAVDQLWAQHIEPGDNFDHFFASEVQVSGADTNCPPIESFEDAFLTPLLLDNVRKSGYGKPTPIQRNAMLYIAKGRDVMGCAPTGSGKTAAYLLPILSDIMKRGDMTTAYSPRQEPIALVVAPTRELAIQIKDEGRKFAHGSMVSVSVIYGGTSVRAQHERVQKGCSVLVATPGRLMGFIDEGRLGLHRCRYVVLDEADRMLDMNFEQMIRRLMDLPEMPPKGNQRQTIMLSATFRPEIQQLAQDFLHNQIFVTVGKVGSANADVIQEVLLVPQYDKLEKLNVFLNANDDDEAAAAAANEINKTLVFVERKRMADFIASRLSQMGISTTSIHGDREQREREAALYDFKSGRCPVLVATAVASRGLDIVGVDRVINYDLPQNIDDYVHRIGRTGRVGNRGKATTFYDPDKDKPMAPELIQVLRDAQQIVPEWLLAECGLIASAEVDDTPAVKTGGNNEEPW